MPKVEAVTFEGDIKGAYLFYCPGCKHSHMLPTTEEAALKMSFSEKPKAMWKFNGDVENPTFEPSIRSSTGEDCCHFFIRNGKFEFLNDCTHELAGQTIEMEEVQL